MRAVAVFLSWVLIPFLFAQIVEAAEQPTGQGIFTEQQAVTGKKLYEAQCASCHGVGLVSGTAPALIGTAFVEKWGGKALPAEKSKWTGFQVGDLLATMIKTMPPKVVGVVSPQDQLSILTYLLQRNGFPAGSTTLTADSATLHDSTLAFRPTVGKIELEQRLLVWVDRQGHETQIPAPARNYYLPNISPDKKRIAVEVHLDKPNIWIVDIATGSMRQLTHEGSNRFPLWSPDGKRVLYSSDRYRGQSGNGSFFDAHEVYWQAVDGNGEAERLTFGEYPHGAQKWTPDGKTLSFYEIHPATDRDIWMLPFFGDKKPWPFLKTPAVEGGIGFSRDGKWLAYTTNETGRFEIMIRSYPDAADKHQITTDGGVELLWPKGSKELFYRNGKKRMAVEIATGKTLTVGTPRVLFEGNYVDSPGTRSNWDSLDGQRFLLVKKID